MPDAGELRELLESLEGKGYKSYKRIAGTYGFPDFELRLDHVQGDPFADASRLRAMVAPEASGLPEAVLSSETRRTAAANFLNRAFSAALEEHSRAGGSGKSGELSILRPGQAVLRRTSMIVHADGAVEARFRAGLPARGRTILGKRAAELLCEAVPAAVSAALLHENLDGDALLLHVHTVEDARALRRQLAEHGLVSFVADGAVLPRRSGIEDAPMDAATAVPFEAPPPLRVTLEAPNAGPVTGMGVPEGVTLLVGGGFHGKSTLLRAIERGVYDHIPGDGRERVVTRATAVKVRAEDGRRIAGTDISNFIDGLPGGEDTRHFETRNASGSTSQAAAIAEALEMSADCLLLDEDTSATNFLIRDARVQALIERSDEPITPFIDRVRDLHRERGVSLVMVVGGSGDYFDVADTVIAMRGYRPHEATADARRIAADLPTRRSSEATPWRPIRERIPLPDSIDPSRGRREVNVKTYAAERVLLGTEELDLGSVEQLVEAAQTRAIARTLAWARGSAIDGRRTVASAAAEAMRAIEAEGLDTIDDRIVGDYAEFRPHELAAAMNRLRMLEVRSA